MGLEGFGADQFYKSLVTQPALTSGSIDSLVKLFAPNHDLLILHVLFDLILFLSAPLLYAPIVLVPLMRIEPESHFRQDLRFFPSSTEGTAIL